MFVSCVLFVTYLALNNDLTVKSGYRSLKIIETGTIRKLWYYFLFVFHSDYGAILYHFREIASFC